MFINIIALYRDIVKKKTYIKNDGKDYALPSTLTYAKMISSFTISLAHALILLSRPVHSKAFSAFSCSCLVSVSYPL